MKEYIKYTNRICKHTIYIYKIEYELISIDYITNSVYNFTEKEAIRSILPIKV